MSVTSGGTAPNGAITGGRSAASAGSAGIVITFCAAHPPPSRYHIQIEADRSSTRTTTPTNPYALVGSCAGRSSSTIWCSSPRSTSCTCRRRRRSQKCSLWPYLRPSSSSPTTPSSIIDGVPHSLVTTTSWAMCHQRSYARYCGPRSTSHRPSTSKEWWSSSATPPGPVSPLAPPRRQTYIPSGPQWRVCGRE